jgi:hypothetical protein
MNSSRKGQLIVIALLLLCTLPVFFACESASFDSDKRQIMAKDEIRSKLQKIHEYDITAFREDTVEAGANDDFKKLIRYRLSVQFIDSNNVQQKKTGDVFFTPDGKSIIRSTISDR